MKKLHMIMITVLLSCGVFPAHGAVSRMAIVMSIAALSQPAVPTHLPIEQRTLPIKKTRQSSKPWNKKEKRPIVKRHILPNRK